MAIEDQKTARCKVCGEKAKVSKWWTRARNGKIYYYIRYQHGPKVVHRVRTDSTFERFIAVPSKVNDIYVVLESYITERMRPRRFRYASLVKELERTYKITIFNQEFNRALSKAISMRLLTKEKKGNEILYSKPPPGYSNEEIIFNQADLGYVVRGNKVDATVFLGVTNHTNTPLKKIPFYIPVGMLHSLKPLYPEGHDEIDRITLSDMEIVLPMDSGTLISVSLNRILRKGEQGVVFLSYRIPIIEDRISLLAPARIDTMRITTVSREKYNFELERTLADGVRETIFPFRRKCISRSENNCLEAELDLISKGESISIRLGTY